MHSNVGTCCSSSYVPDFEFLCTDVLSDVFHCFGSIRYHNIFSMSSPNFPDSPKTLREFVSETSLESQAETVLPSVSRVILVAWIRLAKTTVFRSSFDSLSLLISLLSSDTSFRRRHYPERYDMSQSAACGLSVTILPF